MMVFPSLESRLMMRVDLTLCSHIDAAGRLVEHQQVGVRKETFGENHLLLVASGKLGSLFFDAVGGDLQLIDIVECNVAFHGIVDDSVSGNLAHVHHGHIAPDGQDGEQALRPSFFGHQGDACRNCVLRTTFKFLALEDNITFVLISAIDGARQLGFSCANQPVKTGDLACMDFKGYIVQPVVGEVTDLKDRIRAIALPRCVLLKHGFPDHHLDQFRPVLDLRHRLRVNMLAISHDGHIISDLENLIEPVGNVDDCDIVIAQTFNDGEQSCDFALGDRSRGLIHDDDIGLCCDRFGNLNDLFFRDTQA